MIPDQSHARFAGIPWAEGAEIEVVSIAHTDAAIKATRRSQTLFDSISLVVPCRLILAMLELETGFAKGFLSGLESGVRQPGAVPLGSRESLDPGYF
jgi:hypothetical protein